MFMDLWPPNWTLIGVRSKPSYKKRGKKEGGERSCSVVCRKHRTEGELVLIFFVLRQRLLSRGIRTEKWKKKYKRSLSFHSLI